MGELQAKWVFDQGGFSKVLVVPTPMGAGYHLHLGVPSRNPQNEQPTGQRYVTKTACISYLYCVSYLY